MLRTPRTTTRAGTPRPKAPRRLRTAFLASAASVCLIAASAPAPAPLGIGDRLFPYLGNPGYDVTAYDLAFTYPGSNSKPLPAVTTIEARTTDWLEQVNLDYSHGTVRSVEVDGEPAEFRSAGEDLVVTPAEPLPPGVRMRITVRHDSNPVSSKDQDSGWVRTEDGLAMANQADAGTGSSRATTTPRTRPCSPSGSPRPTATRPSPTGCPWV